MSRDTEARTPTPCPNCHDAKMVGRVEIHEVCIDLLTGDAVRDDTMCECDRYECGRCGHEWSPPTSLPAEPK